MIQRLAGKGMVDYVPYKGASLTGKGMIHGQKMKRRHRLAEVFLESISFEGNTHETACRLEHAIDDDLEVALSLLLGQPLLDPSGRDIPQASADISSRIRSSQTQLISLECLEHGTEGTVEAMFTNALETVTMAQSGVLIGSKITRASNGYTIAGIGDVIFSSDLASKLLVRISRASD